MNEKKDYRELFSNYICLQEKNVKLKEENNRLKHKLDFQLSLAETKIKNREKENRKLKEENKKLQNELDDCEKFRHAVFERIEEYEQLFK